MGEMDAYKDVFLSESAEYIQQIVDGLLALESDPSDLEPVEVVFRGAHSLKGMSATMGYERTSDLTHKMESLMDTVRKREQPADHTLIDLMLNAVDLVKGLIEAESEGQPAPDVGELVAALVARTERGTPSAEAPAAPVPAAPGPKEAVSAAPETSGDAPEVPETPAGTEALVEDPERQAAPVPFTGPENLYHLRVTLEEGCVLKSVRAYMVIKRLSYLGTVVETTPSARDIEDERFDRTFEAVLRTGATAEAAREAAAFVTEVERVEVAETVPLRQEAESAPAPGVGKPIPKLSETQTVRISIGHLDNMVDLVGELVILRSRLERIGKELESRELLDTLEELRAISADLQHEVMQTRMVPVGNIFNRFPRMVRDLARDLGKEITFEMEGLDIELDRTVLDEIGDPIVHLLRNAVDHGIESAEKRVAAGKDERGLVKLTAVRERDQVQIVVTDDGRGMDVERIWSKACERGLVENSQRDSYTAGDVLMLTCTPGFSTAETATKVSGRGVGMNVVRGKIEYLGGSLFITSVPGKGSEFVLTLPLTLAIIQALLVRVREQIFALPLSAVAEVLSPDEIELDSVDGKPVVVLRDGSVAPLYHLDAVLGSSEERYPLPRDGENVVLLEIGRQVRALAVQELVARQEVVIKPLGKMFKQLRGLGGATVLGDGRVALILDPRTLFVMGEG